MIALLLALLSALHSYAGDVLFIDLNNSGKEIQACKEGMAKDDPNDQMAICSPNDPEFKQANKDPATGLPITETVHADSIERLIAAKERQGRRFDTIIISGHDGSGRFSGMDKENSVMSSELATIVQRHNLKTSMNGMALWGCYTATGKACQNFWMNNISPNIKSTVGFSLQGPDNTRPENFEMLSRYCNSRKKIAAASNAAEYAQALYGISQVNPNLSICYKNGICSNSYGAVGETGEPCWHTYEELYRRCQHFDPSKRLLKLFEAYFKAKDPRYMNPPPDGEHAAFDRGTPVKRGELRQYYNQLHLWYHCAWMLSKESGYEMPSPEQVLRLTKFDTLKKNFERVHAAQLDQYNQRLQALGWTDLILQPSRMSRAEIVSATDEAVSRFDKLAYNGNETVNGVNPYKMLVMAQGFDHSLRSLETDCTPFSFVLENTNDRSPCVADYGRFPLWPRR